MSTVSLYHRDLGGEGRPPLVLLHGLLGSSRNWQTAGRELAQAFHVFALDLRNHGLSPHAEPMDYPAMAGDVLAWIRERKLGPVRFLGHSMGGKVAMLIACRHPAIAAAVGVVDIAPKDYHWAHRRTEFAALAGLDLARLKTRAQAEAELAGAVPDLGQRKFLLTNLDRTESGGWRWTVNLPLIASSLDLLEENPLRPDDRFEGPSVFIVGGRSNYVRSEDHAAIRRHFPAAIIEMIPAAGHNPHMEAREEFVRSVLGALM